MHNPTCSCELHSGCGMSEESRLPETFPWPRRSWRRWNKPVEKKRRYDPTIDIKSLQNRLLKVCYVPVTNAGLPRVSFFFSFLFLLLQPLAVLMKQTRQAVCDVKQSIFLDVYGPNTGIEFHRTSEDLEFSIRWIHCCQKWAF